MKNITVAVADEVYHHARKQAAERRTSVSRLVTDFLRSLDSEEERMAAARARMEQLFRRTRKFAVGKLEKRDEIYERRRVR